MDYVLNMSSLKILNMLTHRVQSTAHIIHCTPCILESCIRGKFAKAASVVFVERDSTFNENSHFRKGIACNIHIVLHHYCYGTSYVACTRDGHAAIQETQL